MSLSAERTELDKARVRLDEAENQLPEIAKLKEMTSTLESSTHIRLLNLFHDLHIASEGKKTQNLLEAERVKAQKLESRVKELEEQVVEIPTLKELVNSREAGTYPDVQCFVYPLPYPRTIQNATPFNATWRQNE